MEDDGPIDPENSREALDVDVDEIEIDESLVNVGVIPFSQLLWMMIEHYNSIPQVTCVKH